jgi:hypothetical protein
MLGRPNLEKKKKRLVMMAYAWNPSNAESCREEDHSPGWPGQKNRRPYSKYN